VSWSGRKVEDLERRCRACDGFGTGYSSTQHAYPCSTCGGSGARRAPSEVLRDLDVSGSDDELRARLAELHRVPWGDKSDAQHIEVAALASELERRSA
jgi:hypothetical protein